MKNIILFAVLVTLALSFTIQDPFMQSDLSSPETVPYVNLTQYSGFWYQLAAIPFFFQIGCKDSSAEYSFNTDGSIKINNTCTRFGCKTSAIGKAVPQDETNSKLRVTFSQTFNIGAPYWVVRLADDYSYSVVSDPSYRYLWILYRRPSMPQNLYNQIIESLKADGFPVNKIKKTPYNGQTQLE